MRRALTLQRAKCILHLRDDFKWIPPFNSNPLSDACFFIFVCTHASLFFPQHGNLHAYIQNAFHTIASLALSCTQCTRISRYICKNWVWCFLSPARQSGAHTRAVKCRRNEIPSELELQPATDYETPIRNSPVAACFSFCLSCANFHMNHRRFCAVSLLFVWYGEERERELAANNLNFSHFAIAINSSSSCRKECWWQITDSVFINWKLVASNEFN